MNISSLELVKFRNKIGTSFYIFDKNKFKSNFLNYKNSFCNLYKKTEIAYAYKSNYMPILGDIVSENKGMIEVVSDLEYDIALRSISPTRIIYNGPVKTKENLYKALSLGSIINLDSKYEIECIKELLNENRLTQAQVGIRVNFKVLDYVSRFGFNVENGELDRAINLINEDKRIKIISIHSHFSTKEKSLEIFASRTKQMCNIYKKLYTTHPIEYLDIGGGFFGTMPQELIEKFKTKVPSLIEYAKIISSTLLEELENCRLPTLIVEPGVSLVGDTMNLYAEILELKKIEGKNIAICDTSINVVNPTRSTISAPYKIIKMQDSGKKEEVKQKYTIVGNTCMEHDIIIEEYLGICERGDFIVFKNRGAYSNVYTPPFIMSPPPILGLDGVVYKTRDNVDSVISVYNHEKREQE